MMALSQKAMMRVNRKAITFKFKHIYLPLIVLAARFLAVYSFLNWLLVVRSSLVPVADNVADFWLPLVVASILVLVQITLGIFSVLSLLALSAVTLHLGVAALLLACNVAIFYYLPARAAEGSRRVASSAVALPVPHSTSRT